jgi:hypothetical protein
MRFYIIPQTFFMICKALMEEGIVTGIRTFRSIDTLPYLGLRDSKTLLDWLRDEINDSHSFNELADLQELFMGQLFSIYDERCLTLDSDMADKVRNAQWENNENLAQVILNAVAIRNAEVNRINRTN